MAKKIQSSVSVDVRELQSAISGNVPRANNGRLHDDRPLEVQTDESRRIMADSTVIARRVRGVNPLDEGLWKGTCLDHEAVITKGLAELAIRFQKPAGSRTAKVSFDGIEFGAMDVGDVSYVARDMTKCTVSRPRFLRLAGFDTSLFGGNVTPLGGLAPLNPVILGLFSAVLAGDMDNKSIRPFKAEVVEPNHTAVIAEE